jgi:SpoVK/Ycf46/Vps4 family AAA+-type ATPase
VFVVHATLSFRTGATPARHPRTASHVSAPVGGGTQYNRAYVNSARGRFDELFFVDLPTPEERKDIIRIYVQRGLRRTIGDAVMGELVERSEGFADADIEAAVRDLVKEAILRGDAAVTDDLFRRSFSNIVRLSKTTPEQIESR